MRRVYFEHYVVYWAILLLGSWALVVAGTATSSEQQIPNKVRDDCQFTRYPSLCVQTLLGLGNSGSLQYTDMISVLVNKTLQESKLLPTSTTISTSLTTLNSQQLGAVKEGSQNSRSVSEDCKALMKMASNRLRQSLTALEASAARNKEDIQTWLSAALTYQQACKDSADKGHVASHISEKMARLTELSSNALALANRIIADDDVNKRNKNDDNNVATKKRRVAEDDHQEEGLYFPEWVSRRDRKLLQSTTVNANAVVAQDGSGDYRTVTEAVHAASGSGRFVIYVKSGVYKEKVRINKDGVTLIGDGKSSTVITGDDSVAGGSSMPGSATVIVTGDGFIARDISFRNTAGPQGEQALALNIASDRSALYRCSIAGYQDTLYALALRQFYRECDIYGTVDFIFGNAAAIFQNCNLALRRPRGGGYNVILANGRSDPGQNTGFSVQNCKITASSELWAVKHSVKSYLGRPWKAYSRAVVMQSSIDEAISPRGWIEWPGYGSHVLATLYFAEYANVGPGSATSSRVSWPGFRLIGSSEAAKFTVASFISGNSWLPSTKVIYDSGL